MREKRSRENVRKGNGEMEMEDILKGKRAIKRGRREKHSRIEKGEKER